MAVIDVIDVSKPTKVSVGEGTMNGMPGEKFFALDFSKFDFKGPNNVIAMRLQRRPLTGTFFPLRTIRIHVKSAEVLYVAGPWGENVSARGTRAARPATIRGCA